MNEENEEQNRKTDYETFDWIVEILIYCTLIGVLVITVLMVCGIWRK